MNSPQPERQQGRWMQRLRSSSTALAVAAAVVVPCGQARAVEQLARRDEAAGVARDAGPKAARGRKVTGAFLGFRRRVKGGPVHIRGAPAENEIDLDRLMSPKDARRFTDRDFIFSDSLTSKSALVEELEELDSLKDEKKTLRLVQTATTVGGAVALVFGTVKGLSGIERWMKQMEMRDIEEERQLTGQYISVDAGDVDTSIDPTTGKNLTISKPKRSSTDVSTSGDEKEEQAPWLLRVLGLDSAVSSDDDDFWAAPAATQSKPKAPDGDGGGAQGSGGSAGEDGGGGDGAGDGDDDMSDDSSGVDVLDDLLG